MSRARTSLRNVWKSILSTLPPASEYRSDMSVHARYAAVINAKFIKLSFVPGDPPPPPPPAAPFFFGSAFLGRLLPARPPDLEGAGGLVPGLPGRNEPQLTFWNMRRCMLLRRLTASACVRGGAEVRTMAGLQPGYGPRSTRRSA